LGVCKVSLKGLLDQEIINQTIQIKNDQKIVGKLQLKIYWYKEDYEP